MNIHLLKKELEDFKVFHELTEVLKSVSASRYPKLKKEYLSSSERNKEMRSLLFSALQRISINNLNFEEGIRNYSDMYGKLINENLYKLLKESPEFKIISSSLGQRTEKTLLVVLAPNKGYCGDYVKKLSTFLLNKTIGSGSNGSVGSKIPAESIDILLVGKKIHFLNDAIIRNTPEKNKIPFPEGICIKEDKSEFRDKILSILNHILQICNERGITNVMVVMNRIKTIEESPTQPIELIPQVIQLFPLKINKNEPPNSNPDYYSRDDNTVFKTAFPSSEVLILVLISEYLQSRLSDLFILAELSENYMRLREMSKAEENIKNEIAITTRNINKARQSKITKQLIEVQASIMLMEEE